MYMNIGESISKLLHSIEVLTLYSLKRRKLKSVFMEKSPMVSTCSKRRARWHCRGAG